MRRLRAILKHGGPSSAVERIVHRTNLLCIDEAHKAGAPTYKEILRLLDQMNQERAESARVVGLSATPVRGLRGESQEHKTKELGRLFEEELYYSDQLGSPENHRETLQREGYLARVEVNPIATKTRVILEDFPVEMDSQLEEELLERDNSVRNLDQEIGRKLDTHSRRNNILPHLESLARTPGRQIIYFGPTVQDAAFMAFLLARNGIQAAFVSGKTKDSTRRRTIQEFNAGKIRVLCNCEVLTAGFDAPKITDVFIARPTLSSVLFEQMVGRGLRGEKFGGTQSCKVHYCEDDFRSSDVPLSTCRYLSGDRYCGTGVWVPRDLFRLDV
jgi:superfamily II DNA or RNA helicase